MTKAGRSKSKKLCKEGKLCLFVYFITLFLVCLTYMVKNPSLNTESFNLSLWSPILDVMILNLILRLLFTGEILNMTIIASFLGFAQGVSILTVCDAPGVWLQFGVYASFLSFFHFSEFMSIAWSNPNTLSKDSFLLNASIHYVIAAIASWLEFVLEVQFLPEFKNTYYIWYLGILLCTFGEIVRKTAIFTAATNFTHLVQYRKYNHHELITHGIYAIARHPSYMGWFWWSIGTQVILLNPICIVIYAIVSWRFFRDRIFMEEITLTNFFPYHYPDYKKKVSSGLPFIDGCTTYPENFKCK